MNKELTDKQPSAMHLIEELRQDIKHLESNLNQLEHVIMSTTSIEEIQIFIKNFDINDGLEFIIVN